MAFEIKKPKIKETGNELSVVMNKGEDEPSSEKRGELSATSFETERTKEKKSKKRIIPLYNLDMGKYPQKDRLNLAIEKVNYYFQERSEPYLFGEIRTENKEQFYKDGMIDWEKVYAHYIDLFYRDPEEIM